MVVWRAGRPGKAAGSRVPVGPGGAQMGIGGPLTVSLYPGAPGTDLNLKVLREDM